MTPEDSAYPRAEPTKRRWTWGQKRGLGVAFVIAGVSLPIWCQPGVLLMNAAIARWPAEVTAPFGLGLLGLGLMAGRAAYVGWNDARVSLVRIALITALAFLLIPPGTILLVEGVGYLFGTPQAR